jgi:hypothetical protein
MPAANQRQGILERIQRQSPYHDMAAQGLASLEDVQRYIRAFVEKDRQASARRHVADITFAGLDQDPSQSFSGIAGTFGVIKVPNNQTWKCMRVAAFSEANDILYIYRGTPQPQNIVERLVCGADGFYVSNFANFLYMAAGSLMIVQSSKAFVGFHVNLEIERMVPYMLPVAADDLLEDDMNQTPHDHGIDYDWPSVDPIEATAPERHMNAAEEDPADQPDISQQDATVAGSQVEAGQPGQLLPDVSAHLPPKPMIQ